MRRLRIGAGAGYSGDRIEPAVELAQHGRLDYLVFECLAERTIAQAYEQKLVNPGGGYDPFLEDRMKAVLGICQRNGIRIVTNMGAANPEGAARRIREIAEAMGLGMMKVAAVIGDDVLETIRGSNMQLDTGLELAAIADRVVSANAYVGAGAIAGALAAGADIVVTGRAADPALFLGPLIHEFGWRMNDWDKLGKGTLAGHLLECAGQVTGGYFADPGYKEIGGLHRLGFPIGEIGPDGDVELSKVEGSGGAITEATVKEQLLYEIHDPARYLQPDVVADFSNVSVAEVGPDRVRVSGATGRPKTGSLKVSVSYHDGFMGEGQISYAGPGAEQRAQLACDIVRDRLNLIGVEPIEMRCDFIGINALHGRPFTNNATPYEIRLRIAGRTRSREHAARIGDEVEALYTNGPSGGGGAWKSTRQVLAIASGLIDENMVKTTVACMETSAA